MEPPRRAPAPLRDGDSDQRLRARVRMDRLLLTLFATVSAFLAVHLEAFEAFVAIAAEYEHVELDELVSLLATLPLGLAIYMRRRHQDLTRELRARESLQRELVHQAEHDELTGLPNRRLFARRLTEAVRHGDAAVMLLDLDRFKEVNDTLGHHVGDELLVRVAARLRGALRPQDTVARMGGDEFAVLLPAPVTAEEADGIAARLQAALATPVTLTDLTLPVEGSIGLAVAPQDGSDADVLLRHADIAMYAAKSGTARIARYSAGTDISQRGRLVLLSELAGALERDELVVHYQPKAHLASRRVTGVEALVRWAHPRRGLLLPSAFLPDAEQTSLMRPLSLHVLDLALEACRGWRDMGLELTVAVNLSAHDLLDPALLDDVTDALARHGLPAGALELEITETAATVDPAGAAAALRALQRTGVGLAVDDYGTGHAALAHLQQLPVGQLKIDRTFVTTMTTDPVNGVIVRSAIELARHLGLDVVAEGVEDAATTAELTRLGCHFAQGYGLGRPVPVEALPTLVAHVEEQLEGIYDSRRTSAPSPASVPTKSS